MKIEQRSIVNTTAYKRIAKLCRKRRVSVSTGDSVSGRGMSCRGQARPGLPRQGASSPGLDKTRHFLPTKESKQ